MTLKKLALTTSLVLVPVLLTAQSGQSQVVLDPKEIYKPLAESWPTYSGDYTGRRYSALTQVNVSTVKNLTLLWTARLTAGAPAAGGGGGFGGFGGGGGGGGPVIVGGPGNPELQPRQHRQRQGRHPRRQGRSVRDVAR